MTNALQIDCTPIFDLTPCGAMFVSDYSEIVGQAFDVELEEMLTEYLGE